MPGSSPIGAKLSRIRVPDAVQRERKRSGAPLIRDRSKLGVSNDPGSAAHHFATLHAAPRPGNAVNLAPMGSSPRDGHDESNTMSDLELGDEHRAVRFFVARRPTHYPRWLVALNPLALIAIYPTLARRARLVGLVAFKRGAPAG